MFVCNIQAFGTETSRAAIIFKAADKDATANWTEFPLVLKKLKKNLVSIVGIHVGIYRKFDFGRVVLPTGLLPKFPKSQIRNNYIMIVFFSH